MQGLMLQVLTSSITSKTPDPNLYNPMLLCYRIYMPCRHLVRHLNDANLLLELRALGLSNNSLKGSLPDHCANAAYLCCLLLG